MSTAYFRIQLLGTFSLSDGEERIASLQAARLQSLLVYLLLKRGTFQTRQQIAFLFWPETSDAQAQTNLRQLLHTFRHRLPRSESYLLIDERSVGWRADADYVLDVVEFEQAIEDASKSAGSAKSNALERAVAIYKGDLLPNCYYEWLIPERERLAQAFVLALEQLIVLYEEHRNYTIAIIHAQRLLHYDPLHEPTYRHLMRLFALTGDRAAALRIYHTCVSTLEAELDVPPSVATREAYAGLLRLEGSPAQPQSARLPFIGRQTEWQRLQTLWQTANRGTLRIVCIEGEAGLGKTRLVEELLHWAQQQGIGTLLSHSYSAEGGLAYAPLVEWLRSTSMQPIIAALPTVRRRELARLLPELLIADPSLPAPEPMTESLQRQRLFDAVADAIVPKDQALIVALDDLQWCDEETLAWILFFAHHYRRARLLVVATLRNDELTHKHPTTAFLRELRQLDLLSEFSLTPFDAAQTATLAETIIEQRLNHTQSNLLFAATEGNPLFIVETMRSQGVGIDTGINTGVDSQDIQLSLSPKLHAVISARLAQLSPSAHNLAGVAATIGRSFNADVLIAVCERDEETVVRSLDELWQRRIVRERGVSDYDFSHDRLREVAYAELQPAHRRLLHKRVANALERLYPDAKGPLSAQLAHHYEQSGAVVQAVKHLQQASLFARQLYSYRESIAYLERAIALIHRLPASAANLEHELELQMALCQDWGIITNYLGEEAKAVYERALILCRHIHLTPHLFTVLWGLHEVALYRGDYDESLELALQCLRIAEETGDAGILLQAHHGLWASYYYLGRFHQALTHIEAGLALYQYPAHEALSAQYGLHDAICCALGHAAQALWHLGFLDQATQRQQQLIEHASRLTNQHNIADGYGGVTEVYHLLRIPASVQSYAEMTMRIGSEQGYPGLRITGAIPLGWSLVMQGNPDQGVALIEQAIAEDQAMGGYAVAQNRYFIMLIDAYHVAKRPNEAIAVADRGIANFVRNRNPVCAPDLWTLKGDVLATLGAKDEEIEAYYQQALSLARELGAKISELRAATQLAHLWQRQQRIEQAHLLLTDIYAWFSEGFESIDLRTARQLLEELEKPGDLEITI